MTALLGYNSCTIKFTLSKCTIQWLLVYLWNCTASSTNFRKCSPLLKWWKFAVTPPPFSHPPNPWKSLIFFLFMGWPILEILNTWNHTICSLSVLVYFTQHSVFKAQLCCNLFHYFLSLYGQVILLSMDRPHLLIHPPVAGLWGFSIFWLLWIMLLWTSVCEFLHEHIFSVLLSVYPELELLSQTDDNSMFNFLRSCQTVFPTDCIIFHPSQQCTRF